VHATDVERRLWSRLRAGKLDGFSFRRQHPIGPYIVDFYCAPLKLVVELDGSQHAERAAYDEARTRFLETLGIRVIRFGNFTVVDNFDGVLERLWREVQDRKGLTPTRSRA
jgi:very-short-patch-repair endonuclease